MNDKKLHSIAEAYKKAFLAVYKYAGDAFIPNKTWTQMDSDGTVYVCEKEKIYLTPKKDESK